ncbi:MAG: DUF4910 domain-containing protein [Bacteroidia bacterium]|nr:DUF4910 domain-containing protein [Bacteroidia bacterium]
MFRQTAILIAGFVVISSTLNSCTGSKKTDDSDSSEGAVSLVKNTYPAFNADTAYNYIAKQLSFGYRIPGTAEHKKCADWLIAELAKFCDTVYYQKGNSTTSEGKKIPIYNLVGSFKPHSKQRILLGSHWDSRPWGDNDTKDKDKPILAANDGASGVGVLLTLAYNLKKNPPPTGVDIILFDAEDLGKPDADNSFCLGSQYWAKNPHTPNYKAQFGVLLDMVGGKNAQFYQEAYSTDKAGWVVSHVWDLAEETGQGARFVKSKIGGITDDHVYVTEGTGIPMIDIIQYSPNNGGFADYWHTHADNLESLDKGTLQSVGIVVSALVFNPPFEIIQP